MQIQSFSNNIGVIAEDIYLLKWTDTQTDFRHGRAISVVCSFGIAIPHTFGHHWRRYLLQLPVMCKRLSLFARKSVRKGFGEMQLRRKKSKWE